MTNQELKLLMLQHAQSIKTQKSFAEEIGYSVGKVNYVLKKLIEKGLIKAERFINSENKAHYKYLLTEKGLHEKITLTRTFIEIKKNEYEKLQRELEIDIAKVQEQ
ncbi:MAG: MarR family EPS-associated transcriptional regulator [Campylobacterales bacterium]|nr:MarR family EPS-associated transcriptional regulator [Campylobacterales bacterium]